MEKLRPFSHLPGTECVVPLSDWVVKVYPTVLKGPGFEVPLSIEKQFTVQLDLERDCVWIWGVGCRYKLVATENGLMLNDQIIATGGQLLPKQPCERLSLGIWKSQDIDLMRRRNNLKEIAPIVFLLNQKMPQSPALSYDSFSGLFVSTATAPSFRHFLIQDNEILPNLPKDWHCGRAYLHTPHGPIELEWTKGRIRTMTLHSETSAPFIFRKVDSYRCRSLGKKFLFDRFQK